MIKEPEHFSYEVQAEKAWAVHYGEEKAQEDLMYIKI